MSHGGKFGFSWSDEIQRAPLSLTKRYVGVATGNVGDAMHRLRMMDPGIKPVGDGCVFAGSAFTVKVPPTDNLMVHVALNLLQPNDVLVVDTGGDISHAIVGEIMTSVARGRGAVASLSMVLFEMSTHCDKWDFQFLLVVFAPRVH